MPQYADYSFYIDTYYGDVIAENDFPKWESRAEDKLNQLTFGRLMAWFPEDTYRSEMVKKSVCAIAEILLQLDQAEKSANVAQDASGNYHSGKVSSVSAGSESLTYDNSTQQSAVLKAASDRGERERLLFLTAAGYLSGISNPEGIPLLYTGVV